MQLPQLEGQGFPRKPPQIIVLQDGATIRLGSCEAAARAAQAIIAKTGLKSMIIVMKA